MHISLPCPAEVTDQPAPVRRSWRAALVALEQRLFVDAFTANVLVGEAMPSEEEAIFERRGPYVHGRPPMY